MDIRVTNHRGFDQIIINKEFKKIKKRNFEVILNRLRCWMNLMDSSDFSSSF